MSCSERKADVVIIGGSLGGCAAALAALKTGSTVIMTEETKWIGGQLTSQGVPPDEHPWIESFGCTRSYRQLRRKIREFYLRNYPVVPSRDAHERFNPGNAIVSGISHEPRVALQVLQEMLLPYLSSGQLVVLTEHRVVKAETDGDRVRSVVARHLRRGEKVALLGAFFLDATECGDVLPLAGVEYVTGAESEAETGEPHAVRGAAQPQNMQAFTFCFALDYREGENHTIPKPVMYDFWKQYQAEFWPAKQLSWYGLVPHTLEPVEYALFSEENRFSLWRYRRIIDRKNFTPDAYASDITLVNWPQNDYWLGSIIDVEEEERQKHLEQARQLSLSFLYWMQTEAPRPDGRTGYPGLRLRPDVLGTDDGLAMYPYIRESRRIKAEFTVLEQHVSAQAAERSGPARFADSVGVGCYRIDLHPSTGLNSYLDLSAYPYQIPLGSLIPVRVDNLIPACKNIGTTHITNGCFRLHPTEWNIGEAAGYLVSFCKRRKLIPRQVRHNASLLAEFQRLLRQEGVELEWPVLHPV